MFNKWKNTLLIMLFICSIISCHKYNDDDFISWQQPEKRLEGVWQLSAYIVEGADSTAHYLASSAVICNYNFNTKQKRRLPEFDYYLKGTACKNTIYRQEYSFRIKRATLDIEWNFPASYYTILKLYKDDWWIQSIYARKSYLIKFKKIG